MPMVLADITIKMAGRESLGLPVCRSQAAFQRGVTK